MGRKILLALVALLVVIQLVPVARTNPPASAPLELPPAVATVFRQSCADCHSHETRWPWYAYVAPASWLVTHDVKEGREHFNVSTWGSLEPKRKARKIREVAEEVSEGEMPIAPYLLLHRDAALSPDDIDVLVSWSNEAASAIEATLEPSERGHDEGDEHEGHDD
jgi:hypothetical protein